MPNVVVFFRKMFFAFVFAHIPACRDSLVKAAIFSKKTTVFLEKMARFGYKHHVPCFLLIGGFPLSSCILSRRCYVLIINVL